MEKEKTLYEVIGDLYDSVVKIVFTVFL